MYTLSDLGDSSNLIGSLSRTMTLYSPRYRAVNINKKITISNYVCLTCLSCPSATFALQSDGFVPREWLATKRLATKSLLT